MGATRGLGLLLTALAVLLSVCWTSAGVDAKKGSSERVAGAEKLAQLRGRVRDGVLPLTNELFERFVARPDRPYHMVLLFTATADKYKCETCTYVCSAVSLDESVLEEEEDL